MADKILDSREKDYLAIRAARKKLQESRETASRDKKRSTGLTGVDGLRAMACLGVIMNHILQRLATWSLPGWGQEAQAFLLMGNAGLSIFFVLSGFLLSYPFWKEYFREGHFPGMKQYILRRAARIMPGYYISLLVSALLVLVFGEPYEAFMIRLLAGLAFVSGFHYVTFFPTDINDPLWSVSFEVFCYLLLPLFMVGLFKFFKKRRTLAKSLLYWTGVIVLVLLVNQLIHIFLTPDEVNRGWGYGHIGGAKHWMPNYNPVSFFSHFAIGIMAAGVASWLFTKPERIERFKKAGGFDYIGMTSFLCSIVFLWFMRHVPEFGFSLQGQPYYFPFYPLMIGAVLAVTPHSNFFGRLLDNRFFRYTAKVSFGLYIWHYLIIISLQFLWAKNYYYMGVSNFGEWVFISMMVVAISYVVAVLSYRFIEKPFLDWAHQKKAVANRANAAIRTFL